MLIFGSNSFAAKYCLNDPSLENKNKVAAKLRPYLKTQERVDWEGDCFSIDLSSGRDILFQKVIGETAAYTVASDVVVTQKPCELELIEESQGNRDSSRYQVGSSNSILRQNEGQSEGKTTSRLLLTSGRPGKLYVDETFLEVVCSIQGVGASAEVELWLVGSKGRTQISTTLSLAKGQRQFLGDVVKELKDKNKEIDIPNKVTFRERQSKSTSRFYLVLN